LSFTVAGGLKNTEIKSGLRLGMELREIFFTDKVVHINDGGYPLVFEVYKDNPSLDIAEKSDLVVTKTIDGVKAAYVVKQNLDFGLQTKMIIFKHKNKFIVVRTDYGEKYGQDFEETIQSIKLEK
jgi:hypothetical protein